MSVLIKEEGGASSRDSAKVPGLVLVLLITLLGNTQAHFKGTLAEITICGQFQSKLISCHHYQSSNTIIAVFATSAVPMSRTSFTCLPSVSCCKKSHCGELRESIYITFLKTVHTKSNCNFWSQRQSRATCCEWRTQQICFSSVFKATKKPRVFYPLAVCSNVVNPLLQLPDYSIFDKAGNLHHGFFSLFIMQIKTLLLN